MNTSFMLRLMVPEDIAAMLAIYAPYVTDTAISFEYEVPSLEAYTERIAHIAQKYPCIVCEENGELTGFAYASEFRYRAAYQWCAESTIYLDQQHRGKGTGTRLYRSLMGLLERMGYTNVFAGVALPNEGSEQLHRKSGFREIGEFRDIGFKHGAWHSTRWYQLSLAAAAPATPQPPLSLQELISSEGLSEIQTLLNNY
ncbi:MAG: GNAT family N-acetyltransferase [Chitinophagaceae bacterium]